MTDWSAAGRKAAATRRRRAAARKAVTTRKRRAACLEAAATPLPTNASETHPV